MLKNKYYARLNTSTILFKNEYYFIFKNKLHFYKSQKTILHELK
jgi:hypothetical protein